MAGVPSKPHPLSSRRRRWVFVALPLVLVVVGYMVYSAAAPKAWAPTAADVSTADGSFSGIAYLGGVSPDSSPSNPLGTVVKYDLSNGKHTKIADLVVEHVRPSPDGTRVAVTNGKQDILVWDGSGDMLVLPDMKGLPVWSSDGNKIAASSFSVSVNGFTSESWVCEIDGSNRRKLPVPTGEFICDWSPDGKQLLTTADPSKTGSKSQVFLIRLDGSGRRALTDKEMNFGPRFSHSGRSVCFIRQSHGTNRLMTVGVNGGAAAEVARLPSNTLGGNPSAAWLPDDRHILVCSGTELLVVEVQSGKQSPLQLAPVKAYASVDCQ